MIVRLAGEQSGLSLKKSEDYRSIDYSLTAVKLSSLCQFHRRFVDVAKDVGSVSWLAA